jgi:hypothetical protein
VPKMLWAKDHHRHVMGVDERISRRDGCVGSRDA